MIGSDEQVLIPGEVGSEWYAFHTRPRREKKAAEEFNHLGLRYYLPLREQVTRRGRRTFRSQVPLFAGYVLACCSLGERASVMRAGHCARWLEVKDQAQFLTELQSIRAAVERGTGVKLYPRLTRGQWVRVMTGPLRGVIGRISRRKQQYRIVLEMTALQAAVSVEVDMKDVELVADPKAPRWAKEEAVQEPSAIAG